MKTEYNETEDPSEIVLAQFHGAGRRQKTEWRSIQPSGVVGRRSARRKVKSPVSRPLAGTRSSARSSQRGVAATKSEARNPKLTTN